MEAACKTQAKTLCTCIYTDAVIKQGMVSSGNIGKSQVSNHISKPVLSIYKSHIDLLGDTEGLTLVTDLLSLLEGCPYERGVLIRGVNFCDKTCSPY